MKKLIKHILLASLPFFAAGLGWGFWSHKQRTLAMAKNPPLKVLCAENWLPDQVLRQFSAEHQVSIQQWTYANPSEFLRQMANADGKIDVVCTSSLLLKSLISSNWIKKAHYSQLENSKYISVDFLHLPYDGDSEYSIPAFWNLYGFFGKGESASASWKQTLQSKKVALWGEELNVMNLLTRTGVKIEERLQDSETKSLESDLKKFWQSVVSIYEPTTNAISAEAITAKVDWIQIPLSHVARLLGESSPYKFWLPTDGGTIDVGIYTIGEKSEQADMALSLINFLISSDQALELHKRLGGGVVHTSLNHFDSIAPLQKAEALRRFPLTRYTFPDLSVDAIPRFQKFFSENKKSSVQRNE